MLAFLILCSAKYMAAFSCKQNAFLKDEIQKILLSSSRKECFSSLKVNYSIDCTVTLNLNNCALFRNGRYFGIRNASNASLVKVYQYSTYFMRKETRQKCGKARNLTFFYKYQKNWLFHPLLSLLHREKSMVNITWLVRATQSANPGPVSDLILMHSMDENFQIKSQNVVSYAQWESSLSTNNCV